MYGDLLDWVTWQEISSQQCSNEEAKNMVSSSPGQSAKTA